jgi:predicted nucleotidyltransferase component of viral defense system
MNQTYLDTARLLTRIAPFIFTDETFALKGGTAINLFIRDMPRLSVDLDLVFRDHNLAREAALAKINQAIRRSQEQLQQIGFETHTLTSPEVGETKLLVRRAGIEVKVEVNFVMRGTVYPVSTKGLRPIARDTLLADLEIPLASIEDIYGGKLVAALDRQHPRDLFDVMHLFQNEGITDNIRRAFVVYLACHNRPIHEVLFPTIRDIRVEYERSFKGMTEAPVEPTALEYARQRMLSELQTSLDLNERRFLVSLAAGIPEWALLGIPHIENLPAMQWKLKNLAQLKSKSPQKFATQHDALAALLR